MSNLDLQEFGKNRKKIKDIFSSNEENVEIAGWVHNTRALGKIRFLVLRDISGEVQITAVEGKVSKDIFEKIDSVSRESVIYVKGKVKDSKQAPGGKEVIPEDLIVLNLAEDLKIDVSDFSKTELPKRLDYRFLDLHRKKIQAIFKIQDTLMNAFRKFMRDLGGFEFVFPSIIGSSSEGGTDLFEAKYFEKKVYLSQSCQLYKQMLACSMEKAFSVFTTWRAEKHNTIRHLNEARQLDFEMAFADEFVVMDILEKCVQYIAKEIINNNKEDLKVLGVNLKVPESKYISFKEAKVLLQNKGVEFEENDLSTEAEKKLGELFPDTIVFVYDWPLEGKPFYIMPKDENPDAELSKGFDAIYKGMEISSGGQRVHLLDLLEKRLKANNLDPKSFKSYIDSFRFGAPPHAGWGIGVERLTMLMLGLDNIREACLFPRDRDRLTP